MSDYLDSLPKTANKKKILSLRAEKEILLVSDKKGMVRFRSPYESLLHLRAEHTDFSGDVVRIGWPEEISAEDRRLVHDAMRDFMPWRKGPFSVFGVDIDAEWRSERKWNRVVPQLPDLEGKLVADIGCNNGYYMFRMLHHRPRQVVGFEPFLQHYFCFKTLNHLAGCANLHAELLGVEHLALFEKSFDVIFLMGIIYHRVSPVEMLRDIRAALRPGGRLILESQAIPGDEPVALFPEERYAKVPGTYFVPTAPCLKNWLTRTGFTDIECFFSHPMSSEEQRRSEWMTFESYADFIDRADPGRTVEGYPAPLRVFFSAVSP